MNENSQEHVCSKEQKAADQETSAEGLILKELPSHLKYAFLEPKKGKPVIILAALTEIEEQKLLQILRRYMEAISWSIEDLNSISPSICMHKILLNDDANTSIEHQRRLNPVMKKVFQKGGAEMVECRFYICNIKQLLGEPSPCGSQKGRIHCDQK